MDKYTKEQYRKYLLMRIKDTKEMLDDMTSMDDAFQLLKFYYDLAEKLYKLDNE